MKIFKNQKIYKEKFSTKLKSIFGKDKFKNQTKYIDKISSKLLFSKRKEKFKETLSEFNFSEINPENTILIFSIFAGLLLSLLVFSAVNVPLSKQNKKLKNEVKTSLLKKENISNVKLQYNTIKKQKINLEKDREFIINLVAGTKNLDTFMAVLNENANKNFIEIIEFEPQKILKYDQFKNFNPENSTSTIQNNLSNSSARNAPPPSDISSKSLPSTSPGSSPNINISKNNFLIIPEIEQHEIKISLKGNYTEIFNFIRDIELLENIVLIGDFEIKRLEDVLKTESSKVEYKTNVSAFGRVIKRSE